MNANATRADDPLWHSLGVAPRHKPAHVTKLYVGMVLIQGCASALGMYGLIVALLIILLVVRPLVTRAFEALPTGEEEEEEDLPDLEIAPALAAPEAMELLEDEVEDDLLIDIGRVEGRVNSSSVRKIAEIVDKHPEEAVGIIRGWMYQES